MASVHDVAAHIVSFRGGQIDTYSLEKLAYYSQAWSLVWDRKPLFDDRIEAWKMGPVVRTLFASHRKKRVVDSWPDGNSSRLSDEERATIESVVEFYSALNGDALSELTHREDPWLRARDSVPADASSTAEISHASLVEYYGKLATNGKKLPDALMTGIRVLLSIPGATTISLTKSTSLSVDDLFPE